MTSGVYRRRRHVSKAGWRVHECMTVGCPKMGPLCDGLASMEVTCGGCGQRAAVTGKVETPKDAILKNPAPARVKRGRAVHVR